ncbi:MAG TPA: MCE family protein [Streptosporangiaceae bacterium]|nr:MCE family protein [Streptosporangiaceae bacterium]
MRDRLRHLVPSTSRARITALAALLAVIALVSALLVTMGGSSKQITAYFSEAIGVYAGSDVDILGVRVGTIDSVQPAGQQVKVTMTVDGNVPVPAKAGAVVVAGSVVADRYIQLTPAYTGGPQLADKAVIPASRTATPVEVDQLYNSLNKLAGDLGPNGANVHGALSDVLNTGAANLAGNGKYLGNMITQLGAATRTLSGSRGDLFATVNNLQKFTTMLAGDDSQVRLAQQQLSQVIGFLSSESPQLAGAMHTLSIALGQVKGFISSNRALLTSNVSKLATITKILADERASLTEAINVLPLAVDNVLGAYDPATHTLNARGDLRELTPGIFPSSSSSSSAATPNTATGGSSNEFCASQPGNSTSTPLGSLCQQERAAAGNALVPISPSQQASMPPLPLPAIGTVYGSPSTQAKNGG